MISWFWSHPQSIIASIGIRVPKSIFFYAIYGPANRFPLSFISYHITARGQLHFCHTISFFPLPAFYVPMKILFIFCLFMVRLRDVTFFDGFFPLKLHKWGNLSFAADNHSAPWSATVGQKGSNMWNKNCTLGKRLIIIRLTFFLLSKRY